MINKKGFEMSFGWIFSIIVGAIIIFLAIYAATQFGDTETDFGDSEAAQQLNLMLQPIETSSTSLEKPGNIVFPSFTRIYNDCQDKEEYGYNEIKIIQDYKKSKTEPTGVSQRIRNKYIFSESVIEGKSFFLLVKPIYLPYKIGDQIILGSEEYCFVNPPTEIEDEMTLLEVSLIKIVNDIKDCTKNSTSVCFSSNKCSINVDLNNRKVSKEGKTVYYEEQFLYGAIFSDTKNYECQIKRIGKRCSALAGLYAEKSYVLGGNCGSAMVPLLEAYSSAGKNLSSVKLNSFNLLAKELEDMNSGAICGLWWEKMQ